MRPNTSPLAESRRLSAVRGRLLAERRRIMEPYHRSNEWVARRFFPSRVGLFPPLEPGELILLDGSGARTAALYTGHPL